MIFPNFPTNKRLLGEFLGRQFLYIYVYIYIFWNKMMVVWWTGFLVHLREKSQIHCQTTNSIYIQLTFKREWRGRIYLLNKYLIRLCNYLFFVTLSSLSLCLKVFCVEFFSRQKMSHWDIIKYWQWYFLYIENRFSSTSSRRLSGKMVIFNDMDK